MQQDCISGLIRRTELLCCTPKCTVVQILTLVERGLNVTLGKI